MKNDKVLELIAEKQDFVPFGNEWVKSMMQFNKAQLIEFVKKYCQERNSLEEELKFCKSLLKKYSDNES